MSTVRRAARLARHAVVFEINIYRSLARWLVRRPSVPAGWQPVGYARTVTPVLCLWIFGSAVEIPIAHVLVPWHGVRIALLVVGVWGLLWMVGLLAGMRAYPHLLSADVLRVRNGPMHDIAVPLAEVAGVSTRDRSLPSSMWVLQTEETDEGRRLAVAVGGEVNVHLSLLRPLELATRRGPLTVTAISLWADEPRELAARLREAAGLSPRSASATRP